MTGSPDRGLDGLHVITRDGKDPMTTSRPAFAESAFEIYCDDLIDGDRGYTLIEHYRIEDGRVLLVARMDESQVGMLKALREVRRTAMLENMKASRRDVTRGPKVNWVKQEGEPS